MRFCGISGESKKLHPPPIEEGIIGGPVSALRKGEGFEKSYLEANDAHKKKMEEQLEKDSGG